MIDDPEALREWMYWEHLNDEARAVNTEGVPPYDLDEVAITIWARLIHISMRDCPVLDLGCGTGRLTEHLAGLFPWHEFWAMDISQQMLNRVPARENIKTFLCDGRTLPNAVADGAELWRYPDITYAVTMFQHIPHEAQEGYIFQVAQLLQPGGHFVFTIATGSEDQFLTHQVPDRAILNHWCWRAGLEILSVEHEEPHPGWTLVTTAVPL